MKYAWITGRFLLATFVLVATFVSMGSYRPLSQLVPDSDQVGLDASTPGWNDETNDEEPIGKAEDLVKDWDKPEFALFITGRQHGYIEPCGCITLARQKGGLMRRHTVQKILQQRGWDVVPLDAGNQVRRFGQQPVIKLAKTYEALCKEMHYEMVGLGPDDLKLPAINLAQTMNNMAGGNNPFTCANVEVFDQSFTNKFVVIERNGKKIGVTMILGEEHTKDLAGKDNLTVVSPEAGLQGVLPELESAKCDMKVLFAFSSPENCRKLAEQFPVFDVLVTAGGAGDPTLQPEIIQVGDHATSMIQVGVKGMYVGLIGFYEKDGRSEIKYERVQLDHRYGDSESIKTIFKAYQDELKVLWETNSLEDIEPREHPSGYTFVGSDSCQDCHSEEYDIWLDGIDGEGGPHAEATASLEQNPNDDRVWVQRQFDPECISCHATGWNPQNFYPYKSGMIDVNKQKHLHANGCENCHGPGSAHVAMEEKAARGAVDKDLRQRLANEMVLTLAEARSEACKECHDLDNSPDFLQEGGFDEYWPKIEHGGN